jgi:hypothetical protein
MPLIMKPERSAQECIVKDTFLVLQYFSIRVRIGEIKGI